MDKQSTIQFLQKTMPGMRNDGITPNWQHPIDVANIVDEMLEATEEWPFVYEHLIHVALLHDILEDGELNGERITKKTLQDLGFSVPVVSSVYYLTKADTTHFGNFGLIDYFYDLGKNGGAEAKIVKCCDRIANLRDAITTFKPHRLSRYKWETKIMVIPVAKLVPDPWGSWLVKELNELCIVPTEKAKYKNNPELLKKSGL